MGHVATHHYLFHNHAPKPISVLEFYDAVQALCRPRFPAVRYARPRTVALAISGGVDSMALAFLFSSLLKTFRQPKIADNPAKGAFGIIVDHELREGSTDEAFQVAEALQTMGIGSQIRRLSWRREARKGLDPNMPNLESLARTKRYRTLARGCFHIQATSLFFAHHQDDQYETVLMRLLAGHTYRGLQGIRSVNDIPECYDLYGGYKSGLLEDQKSPRPYLSFKPPGSQMRQLRRILRQEKVVDPWKRIKYYLGADSTSEPLLGRIGRTIDPRVPYVTPLSSEDGGIMIYRPLLEFDKDRLIATCEANKVKWFDDHTNKDPTLTMRNAVRHMVRDQHLLPQALQKPAILGLSDKSRRRADLEEGEAQRLLKRKAVVQDFDPNAGTLTVELPTFQNRPGFARNRRFHRAREESRRSRRRLVAAIMVRKLMEFVSPEIHSPPLGNLENTVNMLFPSLAEPHTRSPAPKSFSIGSVMFDQMADGESTKWFLWRAPYSSNQMRPLLRLSSLEDSPLSPEEVRGEPQKLRYESWHGWVKFKLYDGRFWIRMRKSISARFHIEPLNPESLRAFRLALPPKERSRLEQVLKSYAPGKLRYTLPALYSAERDARPHPGAAPDSSALKLTLLALPSLGFKIPGLERWLKYDVRYKKIDHTLLGPRRRRVNTRELGYSVPCSDSRRRRQRHLMMHQRRRRWGLCTRCVVRSLM